MSLNSRIVELKEISLELLERCNEEKEIRKFTEPEYKAIKKRILDIKDSDILLQEITKIPSRYTLTTKENVIYAYDIMQKQTFKVIDATAEDLNVKMMKTLGIEFSPSDEKIMSLYSE